MNDVFHWSSAPRLSILCLEHQGFGNPFSVLKGFWPWLGERLLVPAGIHTIWAASLQCFALRGIAFCFRNTWSSTISVKSPRSQEDLRYPKGVLPHTQTRSLFGTKPTLGHLQVVNSMPIPNQDYLTFGTLAPRPFCRMLVSLGPGHPCAYTILFTAPV